MFSPKETSQKPTKSAGYFLTQNELWLGFATSAELDWAARMPCNCQLTLELAAATVTRCAFKTKPDWHKTWILDLVKKNSRPRVIVSYALMLIGQSWSVML